MGGWTGEGKDRVVWNGIISIDGVPVRDNDLVTKFYSDSNDFWKRVGTILSPKTDGDDITTTGNIAGANITVNNAEAATTGLILKGTGSAASSRGGFIEHYNQAGSIAGYTYTNFYNQFVWDSSAQSFVGSEGVAFVDMVDGSASFANGALTIASNGNLTTQGYGEFGTNEVRIGEINGIKAKDDTGTYRNICWMDGGNNVRMEGKSTGAGQSDFYINRPQFFIVKSSGDVGLGIASPVLGKLQVMQRIDDHGISIFGFDDRVSCNIHTSIDNAGDAYTTTTQDYFIQPTNDLHLGNTNKTIFLRGNLLDCGNLDVKIGDDKKLFFGNIAVPDVEFLYNSATTDFKINAIGDNADLDIDGFANVNIINKLVVGANADISGETKMGTVDTTHLEVDSTGDTFWLGDGSGLPHGSMFTNDTITVSITDTTPVEVGDTWTTGQVNLVTFGASHFLTVLKAGRYQIMWDMSFTQNTPSAKIEVEGGIMIDGAYQTPGRAHRTLSNSTDVGNFCGLAILDLVANKQISLGLVNETNATDIDVEHANVTVMMVGGT